MFDSLRSRILLVVTGIVFLTTITFMVFAQRETEKAVLTAQDENARNLVHTVTLDVENQYKSILFHKEASLERRKSELKNLIMIALSSIKVYYEDYMKGFHSEEGAKRLALNGIRRIRYDDGIGYVWINNIQTPFSRIVLHPIMPELEGKILDDPKYYCALGVGKHLLKAFVDICLEDGGGYVDYFWPKPTNGGLTKDQPKLSYVSFFKEWGWVVGTGVYIDDIQEEAKRRLDAVITDLRETFSKVKIAETGYMFILSGEKEFLIHPTREGEDFTKLKNPVTGNPVVDELMEAAKTPGKTLRYKWDKPPAHKGDFRFWKTTYITYFKPLDWYICASVYDDEIKLHAKRLVRKIIYLFAFFLIGALILSLLLSRSLTTPLSRLTSAARHIEQSGLASADIPVGGTVETRELGLILHKMIKSINLAVGEKARLVNALGRSNEELTKNNENLQREVAERKEAEKELLHLQNYLSNIVNSMPSVLVGVDSGGCVTQWNLEAEKVTGLAAVNALGRAIPDVLPQFPKAMEEVSLAVRERNVRKDARVATPMHGEIRFLDMTVYPLITNGVNGAVIRIDDVTERVRIEEMVIQSEKMLSVGGLAAGMAHEINNPLAGILQNIQVVKNRIFGDLLKNREAAEACGTTMESVAAYMEKRGLLKMIEAIMESGIRAAKIVENMLSFSRKNGSIYLLYDLGELLDKTIELAQTDYDLKKKYDFRKIKIIREYDTSVSRVPCDSSKIQQVFLNILKNGAQAMAQVTGEEGEEPRFILRLLNDDGMARIEIEDNGPGMDEAVRNRIFEPFFTTKDVGLGTGLGLSVSYFIVTEDHGGTMVVESRPGSGAKFTILLPLEGKIVATG
ncbi:MAG: cache domain-containing protein [Thermodesulfobacteriota bacterium]|nr:cache domain-containing protein [Thermodesulfobacteriota bacterium]